FAGDDHVAIIAAPKRILPLVQAQAGLLLFGPVAGMAFLGEDGPYVLLEIDLDVGRRRKVHFGSEGDGCASANPSSQQSSLHEQYPVRTFRIRTRAVRAGNPALQKEPRLSTQTGGLISICEPREQVEGRVL